MLLSHWRRATLESTSSLTLFKLLRHKTGALSLALLLTLGLLAALPGLALAALTITEYIVPTANGGPLDTTSGSDGNLWFIEYSANKIGKITPGGAITEYPIPTPASMPDGITHGPDGNLWFTEYSGNRIGKITPAGVITEYIVPTPASVPDGIASGSDGNLWFVEFNGNNIGKITPAGVITEYPIPIANRGPDGITSGPDGNLWFTEQIGNNIGKITPGGVVTEYPTPTVGSGPANITSGPDGNLWFTEYTGNNVGKITPAGVITEFVVPTANSRPVYITSGPDGNLWFTEQVGNNIGKVTPAGVITEYIVPTANSRLEGITSGSDGNLWFTEQVGNKIGKVVLDKPPTLSVGFGAASIPVGRTISLTFTVTNPNAATALTGLGFSATLPAGLVVATPNGLTNSCGGTVTATAGSSTLNLSAGTLAFSASCTVKVAVLATAVGSASLSVGGVGVITATETGPGIASNTATLTITPAGTPVVPLPNPAANPADIVAELRVKPDRFASTDPANLISYTLSIKNIGPGKANTATVRFPIDPALAVGYATDFSDSRIWVSAIVADVPHPYIQLSLPSLETNGAPLTLTLVFRPAANARVGASIFTRYQVLFDDATGSGKQQLSNAMRFSLSSDGNRDDTGGAVEFFNPATATVATGAKLTIGGDFYIPNEIVSLWYTNKEGTSVALGEQIADKDGNLSFDLVAGSDLVAGESYSVVGYGNRSGVSGTCLVTIVAS